MVAGNFPVYHWIYWVGPVLGALLASAFFVLLKKLRYRECNPGPDWEDMEELHPQHGPRLHHRDGADDVERVETVETRTTS